MKLFQKLVCMALTATATASLSICAFAADYTFDTAADTDYYPSTSYEDTYGTAYHYGSKNLERRNIYCSNISLFLFFFVILQPLIEMSIYNRYIIKDDSQFE